jgi:DNA primase
MARRLAKVFRQAPDPLARAEYGALMADLLDLPEHLIEDLMEGRKAPELVEPPPQHKENREKSKKWKPKEPPAERGGPLTQEEGLRPVLQRRRKAEETLLKLMLVSSSVIANVSRGRTLDDFSDERLRVIGQLIVEESGHGEHPVEIADLLARASDEKSRNILLLLSPDDALLTENIDQIFDDCVLKIRTESIREKRKRLQSALTDAQRSGDDDAVTRLQGEVNELYRLETQLKQA